MSSPRCIELSTDGVHVLAMVKDARSGAPALVLRDIDEGHLVMLTEGPDIPLVDFLTEALRQACAHAGCVWPVEPLDLDALSFPGPNAFYGYHATVAAS